MKAFEELSYSGQVRRMRRLAEQALAPYNLGPARLVPLTHGENTTFRVEAYAAGPVESQGAAPDGKATFCLRIHRPGAKDAGVIRSELLWLAALRRDTDLHVPEPVMAADGALVTSAAVEGVPGPRSCVLFRWVEGRFLHGGLSPALLDRVGGFMARLHCHAEQWNAPADFVRGRGDAEGLFDRDFIAHSLSKGAALLGQGDHRLFEAVIERVQDTMRALGEGRDVFGVIHADLHQANVLFHRGEVRAIDFDDCGWGYFLYDMAGTLRAVQQHETFPAMRAAFLDGYRRIRPLPERYAACLETFIAARRLHVLLWVLGNIDHPWFQSWAPEHVASAVRMLRAFLDENR